jgi:hypothetical protein
MNTFIGGRGDSSCNNDGSKGQKMKTAGNWVIKGLSAFRRTFLVAILIAFMSTILIGVFLPFGDGGLLYANSPKKEALLRKMDGKPPIKGGAVTKSSSDEELCSGVKQCLHEVLPGCTQEHLKPNQNIKYDKEFCSHYKTLDSLGISPMGVNRPVYKNLGREYRVVYEMKGSIPINAQMMQYLLNNKTFTTKLVNAYKGTTYHIEYISKDRKNFTGTNGRSLKGKFREVYQDKSQQHTLWWGFGGAKVLMWQMVGLALAYLDFEPISDTEIKYHFRTVVFPANSVINSLMQTSMFRGLVEDKLSEIIGDITGAAKQFADGDIKPLYSHKPLLPGGDYYMELRGLIKVIQQTGYPSPLQEMTLK